MIVPTRDREHLLARALDSVWSQTAAPGEVIVVDDGSSDGTQRLVREDFPEAHYVLQEPQGVSAARNRGLREAGGTWMAFLDSDDEWLPDKLERQLAVLAATPEIRVCHTEEVWIRNGRRVNPRRRHRKHGGWIFRECLPLCAMSPSSILIHRSVFDEVGGFDEALPACEDYDLWLRICSRMPVLLVEEPQIVKHGGHEDQLSRRFPAMDRFRIQALEKILEGGTLGADDRAAAAAELERKIAVFAAGARKRGREEEARRLEALAQRWAEAADAGSAEKEPA